MTVLLQNERLSSEKIDVKIYYHMLNTYVYSCTEMGLERDQPH